MTETAQEKELEYRVMDGQTARGVDPDSIEWPDGSIVLYAIEGGEIVGRQGYLFLPHLEGAWVAEHKRGTSLAARLVRKMEEIVAAANMPAIFAYTYDNQPEVGGYLSRFGYNKLPLKIWMKSLSKEP